MTAMEFQQWKQNFIRDYLDEIDDMEVLEKSKICQTHYTQERERSPLCHSLAGRDDCEGQGS